LPLLQLIPLPIALLEWVSPGSASIWSAETKATFAPISIDPGQTLDIGMRQAGIISLALIVMALMRHRTVRAQFVWLMAAIGLLNAVFGLLTFLGGIDLLYFKQATGGFGAVTGTYVNKNHFAGLMEMALPFVVAMSIRSKMRSESRGVIAYTDGVFWMWAGACFLMLVALLLSASRAGVAASVAGLLLSIALFSKQGSHLGKKVAVTVFVGGLIGLVAFAVVGFDTFWQIYGQRGLSNARLLLWMDSLRLVPQFWLLGGGVGVYDYLLPVVKSAGLHSARYDHAHNDYVEFLVTMGPVGLLMFLGVLGLIYRRLMRSRRREEGVAGSPALFAAVWALTAMLLHALLDFNLQIPANNLLFFIVAMLLWSGLSHGRRRRASR
jgi:O-antigen ligase